MKILTGFLLALLFAVLGTTAETQAQSAYTLCNNSPVAITATIVLDCAELADVTLAPNRCYTWRVPAGCTVSGVIVNGTTYPVGYSGPMAPPNPPTFIAVTAGSAVVW